MSDVQDAVTEATARTRSRHGSPTGDTVTVGCKMPNGFILQNFELVDVWEAGPSGGTTVKRARRVPGEYILKGFAVDFTKISKGVMPLHQISGGYGLTPGVPRDFWDKWLEDHKRDPIVTNQLIFAASTQERAFDKAREQGEIKSKLEPLDPDNLPVDVRRIKPGDDTNDE